MSQKIFFDIKPFLGEEPVEAWLCYTDNELSIVGMGKRDRRGRNICVMWEVERGVHNHETLMAMSRKTMSVKAIFGKMLPFVGDYDFDISSVKIVPFNFDGKKEEFWEFVRKNKFDKIVINQTKMPESFKRFEELDRKSTS